jgi:outer membrane protein OmpA-like peptidoglycan-associated protein
MKKIFLLFFTLACCATARGADKDLLTPEPQRITDEAIAADIKTIQALQKRLAELNNKGVPIASYHFAKSQAWLDFALDEYTVNDRSRVVEEALRQALDIIEPLEKGVKEISLATPIIPTSAVVRPDLWAKAEAMKRNADSFRCAGDKIAQLEVQLVWSGHEDRELGWRHSKPYLQAAERLAKEADAEMAACPPAPLAKTEKAAPVPAATGNMPVPATAASVAPAAKPVVAEASMASATAVAEPAPAAAPVSSPAAKVVTTAAPLASVAVAPKPVVAAAPPAAPSAKPLAAEAPHLCPPCPSCGEAVPAAIVRTEEPLPGRVHYALNRADLSEASREVLDRVAAIMRAEPNLSVALNGHADQRGEKLYNLKLSRQRAARVRAYLTAAGIAADRITVAAYGKGRPLIAEQTVDGFARNRRVELVFSVSEAQRTVRQDDDLQPERLAVDARVTEQIGFTR